MQGTTGKESIAMSSLCPFAKATTGGVCPMKSEKKPDKSGNGGAACPVTGKGGEHKESGTDRAAGEEGAEDPRVVPAKCPFGYDSNTFKLGPLSCMVCQALLHDASKCKPCSHKFCKCVRFSWVLHLDQTFFLDCVCPDWNG